MLRQAPGSAPAAAEETSPSMVKFGMFRNPISPYSTHKQFLELSLEQASFHAGNDRDLILYELGTGGSSSEVFSQFVDTSDTARLVSFENNPEWVENYDRRFSAGDRRRIVPVAADSEWVNAITHELSLVPEDAFLLVFIDSAPWESRSDALMLCKNRADIFLVHDVDYFPGNGIFGTQISPIRKGRGSSRNPQRMRSHLLGRRNYDDVCLFWQELFPKYGATATGPPTLIGSNTVDVTNFPLPRGTIVQSSSADRHPRTHG